VVLGLTLVAVVCVGGLTGRQARVWRDTTSLWAQAVRATPACVICHVNLGNQLLEASAPNAALGHFRRVLERALELQPHRAGTHRSLDLTLEGLGRRDEAIEAYRAGLALAPRGLGMRLSLATALLVVGRLDDMVVVVEDARRFYGPAALARYFQDAARYRLEAPVPRFGLVLTWRVLGEPERARAELEVQRRLHPVLAGLAASEGDCS
jgi:tetratricopeptide (TPR) repeat protein